MVYFQKITPEGYKQIEDEITRLKKDRPRRIKILQAARALGDLSENTEYTEAKRDLGHLQSRLRYLGKQLKYAEIVETKDDGKVDLGKTVVLKSDDDEDTEDTEEYKIVGRMEADLADGKISFDSPLGQAIMKKEAGTTSTVEAPAGEYKVTIVEVK
ncbi:transcription elongation factor GreA [Lactobacillus amylovorus]|jgi:transcription elongation factor GreA|uniref:Transcription elongation factor GreA n=1 Tax=Lactobacillus amylovorus TaxID=1604 RepID=A0AAW6BBB1_LACAM|nr:transcription elongation factor GreA [Lactobacillus amylovorus]MDA6089640.1 transcription elongation factor GreA [Lactobacillus amylovorus]MDB6222804.1 transcription elongation factor GreA [Lactobacillus amylovorus]MDB6239868.1 transcription elongation factor GreA [Lactobacillus amylovorus]MDB6246874.1 transcription elongation factor GreA [Lactobacillus amylovorus]